MLLSPFCVWFHKGRHGCGPWIRKNLQFSFCNLKGFSTFIQIFHDFVDFFKLRLMSIQDLCWIVLSPQIWTERVYFLTPQRPFGVCCAPQQTSVRRPRNVHLASAGRLMTSTLNAHWTTSKNGRNSLLFVRLADVIGTSKVDVHLYQVDL